MVLTCFFLVPAFVSAQGKSTAGVSLRPGIIFDLNDNVAYVMTPEGVMAIDIQSGAKRWTSSAATKPLALVGNLLVSQVEPKTVGSSLEVVVLNTQERGAVTVRSTTLLPSDVRVSTGQTLEGTFLLEAQPTPGNVVLIWNFQRLPIRGMVEDPDDTETTAPGQRRAVQSISGGAFEMNLATGAVTRTDISSRSAMKTREWILNANEKIARAGAVQYESSDGNHVLSSERVANDAVFQKYLWTIFDRTSGNRLGEFRSHLSFSPFVVRGLTVFYETTPYIHAGKAEPAKLRAVNLGTGQESWSVEVRELAFRGAYPP
jgi:outer membrane protein assembly factor BamB